MAEIVSPEARRSMSPKTMIAGHPVRTAVRPYGAITVRWAEMSLESRSDEPTSPESPGSMISNNEDLSGGFRSKTSKESNGWKGRNGGGASHGAAGVERQHHGPVPH